MARRPILPSGNETLWGAVSVIAPLVVLIVLVVLIGRYFRRLRRTAENAAARAGAAEREVAALRGELGQESAQPVRPVFSRGQRVA